jgi:hypothetical protein
VTLEVRTFEQTKSEFRTDLFNFLIRCSIVLHSSFNLPLGVGDGFGAKYSQYISAIFANFEQTIE